MNMHIHINTHTHTHKHTHTHSYTYTYINTYTHTHTHTHTFLVLALGPKMSRAAPEPDPSTIKNKTFYLSLCEIRFKQIKITKMNNMGNNIFTSKMRRNKPFFFFKCIKSSFSAQSSFSLQHFYK